MDSVVKKFVEKPKVICQTSEIEEIQKRIDQIQKQIYDAEIVGEKALVFYNEKQAIKIKRKQLNLLKKRKKDIENNDIVASKNYRKINLDFLKRTKKRRVKGRLNGEDVELTIKTPMFSFHQLGNLGTDGYSFKKCEMTITVSGGKISDFRIYSIYSNHIISKKIEEIYETKMNPINIVKWGFSWLTSKEVAVTLVDNFSGLIPMDVKKECVEAEELFDDIFLVKEANWQIELIEKDPLIIGILAGEAYLISQFDCTPFEHYTKSEF